MSNLNEKQIIKLIEDNLDGKFRYYLDNMRDEKRPFGNSGNNQIRKDMMDIAGIKKTWEVSEEEELEDLQYNWMIESFEEIQEWIKNNSDKFKVKLFPECVEGEQ